MSYIVLLPLVFLGASAALALPWFMVREGYREQVQITCACAVVIGLCAACGVFSYFDNTPLAILYGSATLFAFVYALDCALPLILSSKAMSKYLSNK